MDREETASRVSDVGVDDDELGSVSPDETLKSESKLEMKATEVSEEISSPEVDEEDDAVVSHRAAFVVGEDSESEEEDEEESSTVCGGHWPVADEDMIDDIGDADDLLDEDDEEHLLPKHRLVVIEGEASESSDDDDDVEDKNEKEDYVEQPQKIHYTNVMIPRENTPTSNAPSGTSPSLQAPTTNKASKVDSVLHHKLRETNVHLKDAIETQWQKMLKSAAKDLSAIGQGFQRTRQVTQDTSHSMRTLTNNLFKIEDSIDLVAHCDILPDIYLKMK